MEFICIKSVCMHALHASEHACMHACVPCARACVCACVCDRPK